MKTPRAVRDLVRMTRLGHARRLPEIIKDSARLEDALPGPVRRIELEARSVAALVRAGALGGGPPQRFVHTLSALRSYGAFGAAPQLAALRHR